MRRARLALGIALLLFALVVAVLLATDSASAEEAPPPRYDGTLFFPTIRDASYPEDYSGTVELSAGEELVQGDEETVYVEYAGGFRVWTITAEPAADAEGKTVPTTIAVTAPNVVTLTVHHRAGNPAKGGAPFDYPISAGPSWEAGPSTIVVIGPPDEAELRERREREEAAARAAQPLEPAPTVPHCIVPRLKGLNLARSLHRLRAAGCEVGTVDRAAAAPARGGRVVEQSPRPGRSLAAGTAVGLRLG